ncbi:MAG: hypothetical protein ABL902_09800 [Gallionella sp.]
MNHMHSNKQNTQPTVTFVHSLFRSGSTFFYNALKRTGLYHVYHEPMHEVIAALPTAWSELAGQKVQLKATLRHDFLSGGYFDEYAHLLPAIKKAFSPKLSFDLFFMDGNDNSAELKAYVDILIEGSHRKPVLQCTRTLGRINWIKTNYQSNHVFLLRNPWDQWYSYKVDNYIASTPRVIYSKPNLPEVLKEVMVSRNLLPLPGDDTQAKLIYSYAHPISPEADYCLFFGLWLYAFVTGHKDCDVVVDMDEVSSNANYREQALKKLAHIDLASIDLSDANLHRAVFTERERSFYQIIEEQVLEIFRKHDIDAECLRTAREYLVQQREVAFVPRPSEEAGVHSTLEDAARMRKMLLSSGQHSAAVVASLNQAIADRDAAIADRDAAINAIYTSHSWRVTRPLRFIAMLIRDPKALIARLRG